MTTVLDARFIRAMDDIFGEASVERFGENNTERLREVWDRARLEERYHVYKFMRAPTQMERCPDKEWLFQTSWVIGNGTYLTKPEIDAPLSWLSVEEAVIKDDDIRSRLLVSRDQHRGIWHVMIDEEPVAQIVERTMASGSIAYRVTFHGDGSVRIYQDWVRSINSIIAWVRANDA
jgi:hypothetical protein